VGRVPWVDEGTRLVDEEAPGMDLGAEDESGKADAMRDVRPDEDVRPDQMSLVGAFHGHTVGEAVTVMTRLRMELADELARRGAPAEDVAEVRGSAGSRSRPVLTQQRQRKS
jgi:hypothetical protein